MTIAGAGTSATTIQQTAADRVIFASATTSTIGISGVTITGANYTAAAGVGGGILNYGTMTLTDVALTNNAVNGNAGGTGADGGVADGSAVATGDGADNSSLTLTGATVTGNVARGGQGGLSTTGAAGAGGAAQGAIWGGFKATIVIRNSTVSGNQVFGGTGGTGLPSTGAPGLGGAAGGAISIPVGKLMIVDSTIAGNAATGGTGGSQERAGLPGNGGGDALGGGIDETAPFRMTGSTVADNTATGGAGGNGDAGGNGGAGGVGAAGGAIVSPSTIVNSTISGNIATGGAGGGGQGSSNGTQGASHAGGLDIEQPSTLASLTLADNAVVGASASGGNLVVHAAITLADTVIAQGHPSGGSGSCVHGAAVTDAGHNLEDTSPSQCGLSAGNADQVGVSAGLASLASNGGPTQTLALLPGSGALGNGGACTDPTQTNMPLTVDQRGLARPPGACDIGAYQLQPPAGSGAPDITGTPAVGERLSCSQGTWTGDQLTFAYQWQRDGAQIAGETAPDYNVAAGDGGHQIGCQVSASNVKGTASQSSTVLCVSCGGGSGSPSAGPGPAGGSVGPVISGVRQTHAIWIEGKARARVSRARRHPVGTVFSFTLNETASVRFAFSRAAPGRRVGKRCVAQTRRNIDRRPCTRSVLAGSLGFTSHSGVNKVAFQGRMSSRKKLKLGSYTLRITATNAASEKAKPQALRFKIVKR
jgi:hypothetical protein